MKIDEKNSLAYYRQVKELIKDNIYKGSVLKDGRLPTIREMADSFNVSVVTVHKAVSELKDEGLLYSRPHKGIFLSNTGKEFFRTKETSLIFGLTFLDIFNQQGVYLQEVSRGAMEFSVRENIGISLFSTQSVEVNPEENPLFWKRLKEKKVDGLILATWFPAKDVIMLKEEHTPFVWLDNDIPFENINCVLFDDFEAIRLAVNYCKGKKIKKLGIINYWLEEQVVAICRTYLKEKGYKNDIFTERPVDVVKENIEKKSAYKQAGELLDKGTDGLIVGGEISLAGVMQAVMERGLKIPDDIVIVTTSHSPDTASIPFGIPKVVYPIREATAKCGEMLKELCTTGKLKQPKQIIKPYLKENGE